MARDDRKQLAEPRSIHERAGGYTTYTRIEKAASNPEEGPDVGGQRDTEGQGNVDEGSGVRTGAGGPRRIRDLSSAKSAEEKEERPDELADHGHDMVFQRVRVVGRHVVGV